MRKLGILLSGLFVSVFVHSVSAETEGNVYLGLGASSLALDDNRVIGVPTSSPGHSSKMFSAILGYQFDDRWSLDLTLGTDVSGEVNTDQALINIYRFFGLKKWKPYVSAGFSGFSVDNAVDDSTEQIQAGIGVSGALSHNLELRVGYQLLYDLGDESYYDKALGIALNWHFKKPIAVAVSQPVPEPESVPKQKEVVDTFELLVQFDFDKSDVKAVFGPQFEEIARVLKENPEISMTIEGHTCWIGTEEYNQGLSQRRADAVKDEFGQEYGIALNRITTVGFGETRPVADNNTLAGRQKNRRAIAVILRPRIVTE